MSFDKILKWREDALLMASYRDARGRRGVPPSGTRPSSLRPSPRRRSALERGHPRLDLVGAARQRRPTGSGCRPPSPGCRPRSGRRCRGTPRARSGRRPGSTGRARRSGTCPAPACPSTYASCARRRSRGRPCRACGRCRAASSGAAGPSSRTRSTGPSTRPHSTSLLGQHALRGVVEVAVLGAGLARRRCRPPGPRTPRRRSSAGAR